MSNLVGIGSEEVLRNIVNMAAEDVNLRMKLRALVTDAERQPLERSDIIALCDWADAMVKIENTRKKSKGVGDMNDDELQEMLRNLKDDPQLLEAIGRTDDTE